MTRMAMNFTEGEQEAAAVALARAATDGAPLRVVMAADGSMKVENRVPLIKRVRTALMEAGFESGLTRSMMLFDLVASKCLMFVVMGLKDDYERREGSQDNCTWRVVLKKLDSGVEVIVNTHPTEDAARQYVERLYGKGQVEDGMLLMVRKVLKVEDDGS